MAGGGRDRAFRAGDGGGMLAARVAGASNELEEGFVEVGGGGSDIEAELRAKVGAGDGAAAATAC